MTELALARKSKGLPNLSTDIAADGDAGESTRHGGQCTQTQVGYVRLTRLVLSHLLVLILLRQRLLDNLRPGLTLPLPLRRADRTAFAIVVALVALRQVLAKMALRGAELQAATAIAL